MVLTTRTSRGNVLVVDDDAGVRDVCRALLAALGYGTSEASCGHDAVQALSSNDQGVQLVLLDLEMPGMRGDEVLRTVKALLPEVRVLLMSGHLRADLRTYLAAGADGLLHKPFGLSALDSSLLAALGEGAAPRQAQARGEPTSAEHVLMGAAESAAPW